VTDSPKPSSRGPDQCPTDSWGRVSANTLVWYAELDGILTAPADPFGSPTMAKARENNFTGKRGETVFAFLIGKKCNGRFWFYTEFLDGKAEAKDFTVYCIEPACYEATFFAQVKATSRGYTGKGKNRKLRVNVSEKDVQRLKRLTGPAFIVGIDVESEEGYLVPVTKHSRRKYSGIPCRHKIDCTLIQQLWQSVESYWAQRDMAATKSLLS